MAPHPKLTLADFPSVVREWHPTMNGDAKPERIASGATRKCWWICENGPAHVWAASPNARIRIVYRAHRRQVVIRGCPACAGKQASMTNSLAALYPEIASQWHPSKNGDVTPDKVVARSNKRYWWICLKGPDHEWVATPNNRVSGKTGWLQPLDRVRLRSLG